MIKVRKVLRSLWGERIVVATSAVLLLVATLLTVWLHLDSPSTQLPSRTTEGIVSSRVKDRPLVFEEYPGVNGQPTRFLARTGLYSALLEPSKAVVRIAGPDGKIQSVTMRFVDSEENARPQSQPPLPGKVHYLVGHDPALWQTGLSRYPRIAFEDVYPEIDLHYYGSEDRLEYDLVLHSGADPKQVLLEFEGVDGLSLDSDGSLSLAVGTETLQLLPPKVYQEQNQARTPIPASYEMTENRRVRFTIGKYDPDRDLVIDPVIVYSTILGGTGSEDNALIAVDSQGNAYVAGTTDSGDFPLLNPLRGEIAEDDG